MILEWIVPRDSIHYVERDWNLERYREVGAFVGFGISSLKQLYNSFPRTNTNESEGDGLAFYCPAFMSTRRGVTLL